MKKIDTTIDYEALLEEAKRVHRSYTENCDKYKNQYDTTPDENGNCKGFPKDVRDTLKGFYDGWKKWIKENINDRGLHLRRNMMGTPIAIYLVVAGDDKSVYLAENI